MKKITVTGEVYKDNFIDINTYIIDYKGHCFIVDPGYEKEKIRSFIEKNSLEPIGILLTHAHLDHMSALDVYDLPIYISKDEYNLFIHNYNFLYEERGLKRTYSLEGRKIITVSDNDSIPFLDKEIKVISTPGHTHGGVCYRFENDIFTGDTLFKSSVGRTDLPTGNSLEMKESILKLISTLPDDMKVYPAHGYNTSILEEKNNNPFYTAWI